LISPAALYLWLLEGIEQKRPDSLKCVVVGGEVCPPEMIRRHAEIFAGAGLFNEYGPTECTVWSSVSGDDFQPFSAPAMIGKSIANTRIYILDRELEPAPTGVRGEIYISGRGVARGYLGAPDLTADRFIPDRFGGKGERLYRTRDVGRRLPDGGIEFIGRADTQVKVRGYRVEPGEIEAVLNGHRSIKQSVVVASENGGGGKRLIGYVVGEGELKNLELKQYVRERLPEYMVPETILTLKEMPLAANGKIDRKRLPSADASDRGREQEYLGPRTPVEEILVEIFQEELKLDRVGIHDNFFEIGGHSLLAIRVISQVRNTFDVEIGVKRIFEEPTVARLAEALTAQEPKPGQMEKIALILKKLDNMTDEEAGAELTGRRQ